MTHGVVLCMVRNPGWVCFFVRTSWLPNFLCFVLFEQPLKLFCWLNNFLGHILGVKRSEVFVVIVLV